MISPRIQSSFQTKNPSQFSIEKARNIQLKSKNQKNPERGNHSLISKAGTQEINNFSSRKLAALRLLLLRKRELLRF